MLNLIPAVSTRQEVSVFLAAMTLSIIDIPIFMSYSCKSDVVTGDLCCFIPIHSLQYPCACIIYDSHKNERIITATCSLTALYDQDGFP